MKYIKRKRENLLVTIIISILCSIIYHKFGLLDDTGMAAIILNSLPLIIGIGTIVIYLITNAVSSKYAWITTLLGNLFNLIVLLNLFLST